MASRRWLAAGAAIGCLSLGGCAAALVPIAAAGMGARHHLKGQDGPRRHDRRAPAHADAAATSDAAPDLTRLEAAPRDPAAMRPGQLYVGAVPAPVSSSAAATAAAQSAAPIVAASPTTAPAGWTDVLHYVAGHFANRGEGSAILARGTTLADARWVPCGGKPAALLTDLETVVPPGGPVSGDAAGVIDALQTLDIAVVYLTTRGGGDLGGALLALKSAGLRAPIAGATLLPVQPGQEPAARAAAGARYCVVAIAGDRAADFPNGATPAMAGAPWPPGWFLLPAARP